jgi:hypothetical protein
MAQKENVIITVEAKTGDSAKDVGNLKDKINEVGDSAEKAGKQAEGSKGAFSSLGQAIKTLGAASIILKVFEKFGEILSGNSKITKVLAVATESLSIIVSDFVNFIVDNTDAVVNFFKNAFEKPGEFVEDLGRKIQENLIERFNSLLEVGGFLASAFKNLFTGEFDKALQNVKDAAKESLDVVTGIDDTGNKLVEAGKKIVDYTKNVVKAAQANVDLQNNAELAAARLGGLIEKFDRQAEKERQIRDDTTKSIQERIDANNRLAVVLEESQKAQLAQAGLLIQAADANLKKDTTSIEFQKAKIEAQNQYAAVLAQVEGFRSEQLINQTGLLLEQQNLEKTRIQNQSLLLIAQKKANADLIVDELDKAQQKRKILDEEANVELKRLQDNINLVKEGTQARVDAEIEFANKKQEIEVNKLIADNEIRTIYYNRQLEDLQFIQENELAKFDAKREAVQAEKELLDKQYKDKLISERDYNKRVKELSLQRKEIDRAERVQKEENANAIGGILGALSGLAEQGTALQKGLALAQVGIDTATSISSLMAVSEANPLNTLTFGGAGIAQYAAGIIRILANVAQAKSILSAVPGGGSAASTNISVPTAEAPVTPSFTPNAPTALDQTSINAIGNINTRAYVVESDITGSQKRIRRIENSARI